MSESIEVGVDAGSNEMWHDKSQEQPKEVESTV